MGWTQSLGLQQLVRLARGQASAPVVPVERTPRKSRSAEDKARDMLARRRADLHPDAPPRVPLSASRDLPSVAELSLVETPAVAPAPEPRPATPIRDTTDHARPRPLPRSPEPLSESDLSWVRGLLDKDGRAEPAAEPAPIPLARIAVPAVPREDAPLMDLLGRFEKGVAERIALRDAADAQSRVGGGRTNDAPALSHSDPEPADPSLDEALDEALTAALETLRRLSAKANGGR